MKKLIALTAAAGLVAVQSATAVPTLTISDNAGHTVTVQDGGPGDIYAAAGVVTFAGSVGNWIINVTTGTSSPPAPGYTATHPSIDVSSYNQFNGLSDGTGNVLTITFTGDNLGPINSTLQHNTGGSQTAGSTAEFIAAVNGNNVSDQGPFNTLSYSKSSGGVANVGTGSTMTITAVLTAARTGDVVSFDSHFLAVPDAGMTLAMLGFGLTGVALFARNRKTA